MSWKVIQAMHNSVTAATSEMITIITQNTLKEKYYKCVFVTFALTVLAGSVWAKL